jgi:hypothetical protein
MVAGKQQEPQAGDWGACLVRLSVAIVTKNGGTIWGEVGNYVW